MEALGIYILKATAILALFWGTYVVFLRQETHFQMNRLYLVAGLVSALLLPFVRIPREIILRVTPQTILTESNTPAAIESGTSWPWQEILLVGYLAGTSLCLLFMVREIWRLYRLVRTNPSKTKDGYVYVPTSATEGPFSFFHYIFYNPENHPSSELPMILEHEKAHAGQYHSLDILLGRLVASLLWMSPFSWWYQKSVQQNLEYLADAAAIERIPSLKAYQYTLLKVSGNPLSPGLTTSFYSSLIKNRIVMLNSNPSKSIHKVKHLLILPVLALFLMAFAREDVYVVESPAAEQIGLPATVGKNSSKKIIEFVIDKGTTDPELLEMKKKLSEDNIDFSYTVVRNEEGEITSLELDFNGKAANGGNFKSSYNSDADGPIEPTYIRIDDQGGVFIGDSKSRKKNRFIHRDHDSDGEAHVWVYSSSDGDEDEIIEIREEGGKNVFIINGEDEDVEMIELHEDDGHTKKIKVIVEDGKKTKVIKEKNVMVIRDSDNDADIEVISEGGGSYFFVDTDGDNPPLYMVDGKKSTAKKVKKLDPDQIATIDVMKGDAAIKKYGQKAKNGVVVITTKK